MNEYPFYQVDVFTSEPMLGNPLAVVVGGDALTDAQMAAFANWTNLSETTFLLKPQSAQADYRVRIFTPTRELPFAGHPTLGTCYVWLASGGRPKDGLIVQECAAGLIEVRKANDQFSFAAPPLRRSGPIDQITLARVIEGLHLRSASILASNWVDNGPGWLAVLLRSRAEVLEIRPDYGALSGLRVGVVGAWDKAIDGEEAHFEVRAFTAGGYEDPVTGSLNAGIGQWLISSDIAPPSYIASQGTKLGRKGRVHVVANQSALWVGGTVSVCIKGSVII